MYYQTKLGLWIGWMGGRGKPFASLPTNDQLLNPTLTFLSSHHPASTLWSPPLVPVASVPPRRIGMPFFLSFVFFILFTFRFRRQKSRPLLRARRHSRHMPRCLPRGVHPDHEQHKDNGLVFAVHRTYVGVHRGRDR